MKHELIPVPVGNDPASAFEALRGEVSLMRRALEGLAAERQIAPDYTPTLADMARRMNEVEEGIERLSQQPALKLTPRTLADDIVLAGQAARAEDRVTFAWALKELRASTGCVDTIVRRGRTAEDQWYMLAGVGLACWYVGVFCGAALARLVA